VRIRLSRPEVLLEALLRLIPGASRRTLRQMLAHGRIAVNGRVEKKADCRLRRGDDLEIRSVARTGLLHGLQVVHEDSDLLIILKPAGLLTIASSREKDRTAYAILRGHLKERNPQARLFIVHRLDKLASGLLVFAKSLRVKQALQDLFRRHAVERKYWAIVEGRVQEPQGTIKSHLAPDQSRRMHSTEDRKRGKLAVTHYRVLKAGPEHTALEVTLDTGRKNQIRAHLAEIGHPIAGDRAYGAGGNPLGRLGLHAFQLGFRHPATKSALLYHTDPPPEFRRFLPFQAGGKATR